MRSKWLVLFLIWRMILVAYLDRVDVYVAAPLIKKALGFSNTQFGLVLAAFTLGYAVMQAPGGYLADKFGSRTLLIVAILVWSLFTGLTGLASSLAMVIGIRVVFGVGEGLENGAQFKLVGDSFGPTERSTANAIFLSALALGPAIGTPLSSWLMRAYGWREMFFTFAVLGLVVGIILVIFLPKDIARPQVEDTESTPPGRFKDVLRLPSTWLCAGGYMMFNAAFWGFLGWVPTYMKDERHISLASIGVLGSLPYFAGFVGMLIAGWLGSNLLATKRPMLVGTCYAAAALALYFALTAHGVAGCVTGLSVAGFFLYGGFGPFWAIAIDLAPANARGVFTGSVNCCGQIGSFASQIIIGKLAESMKSFNSAIMFMIGVLGLGAVAMVCLQKTNNRAQMSV